MKTAVPDPAAVKPSRNLPDFSLVQGGLFFRLLRWTHLSDDVLVIVRRRVTAIALFAWLPLLVLTALEGQMLGGGIAVPFLLDVEVHIRFLVALPLLILAEIEVHRLLPLVLQQFLERKLIPENALPRFDAAIESAFRLRNSSFAEVLLIVFVYGVGILIVWQNYSALDVATWYATPSNEGLKFTLAGIWYTYIGIPIIQFLLLRWYWRLFIWARLLWQVSRIKLRLVPAHPDHEGGLGFLAITAYAFSLLAAAHGTLAAGQIASRIFFAGATLSEFTLDISVVVIFVLCVVLGPLLVFTPQIAEMRRTGILKYGALAGHHVRKLDDKWGGSGSPPTDEALTDSIDEPSLTDMRNSYETVRSIRSIPITRQPIVQLILATLVPISPLLLTMISVNELANQLFSFAF